MKSKYVILMRCRVGGLILRNKHRNILCLDMGSYCMGHVCQNSLKKPDMVLLPIVSELGCKNQEDCEFNAILNNTACGATLNYGRPCLHKTKVKINLKVLKVLINSQLYLCAGSCIKGISEIQPPLLKYLVYREVITQRGKQRSISSSGSSPKCDFYYLSNV